MTLEPCYNCPGPSTSGDPCPCVQKAKESYEWNRTVQQALKATQAFWENWKPGDPIEFV